MSLALVGISQAQETDSAIPQGKITPAQIKVFEGSKVDLSWKISYPPTSLPPQVDTKVTVRFITCAIGPRWRLQFGTAVNGEYTEFYHGFSEEHPSYALTPGTVVSETFLSHTKSIEFRAKHEASRVRGQWISSIDPAQEQQIIKLKNGDKVPSVAPVRGQRSVADILAPYSKNGVINISDTQEILLFELYTSDTRHFGFDLQDLVLLVSYEQVDVAKK